MSLFTEEFLKFPNFWFANDPAIDEYFTEKYSYLLEKYLNENYSDEKLILEQIITLDQLSRHLIRTKFISSTAIYDQKARQLVKENLSILENFSPVERCFFLMPLRHTFNPEIIEFEVLPWLVKWKKELKEKKNSDVHNHALKNARNIYDRFYRASLESLSKLKKAIREEIRREVIKEEIFDALSIKNFAGIIREKLDNFQLIGKYQKSGLKEENFHESSLLDEVDFDIPEGKYAISLSAGGDSVFCLKLFAEWRDRNLNSEFLKFSKEFLKDVGNTEDYLKDHLNNSLNASLNVPLNTSLIAIHINYDNRSTSDEEEEVCRHLCHHLQIPLYVRKISEIHRSRDADRALYEEITKNIRFSTYAEFPDYTIVLGHNKDDALENILANIKKCQKYQNLFGMNTFSEEKINQQNIRLYRPLLQMEKKAITDLNIAYQIPFVYDSTPKWSERGKMRDDLIPKLGEFEMKEGLYALAEEMREMHVLLEKMIEEKIKNVKFLKTVIELKDNVLNNNLFWKKLFWKISGIYKVKMVSNKAISNLIKMYDYQEKKRCVTLSNEMYYQDGIIYLNV